MAREKLKNLVILILVLANLFLLALVVPTRLSDRNIQARAANALSQLYAQAGVTLHAEDIPRSKALQAMEMPAPDALEALRVFLGDRLLTQPDGTVTSPLGTAVLAENGTFSVTLEQNIPTDDALAHAEDLLKQLGLSVHTLHAAPSGGGETVTATLRLAGAPLLTQNLTLRYEDGCLVSAKGLPLGEDAAYAVGSEGGVSAADALMAFLRSRMDTGWMGASVLSVTQGYDCTWDAVRQLWLLEPAWQIRTDSGDYLVDAVTCAVKNVTQM